MIPGSLWGAAIIEAIESAPVMVLILSANSSGSPQVLREVERTVATNTMIVPFRIEDIDPSSIARNRPAPDCRSTHSISTETVPMRSGGITMQRPNHGTSWPQGTPATSNQRRRPIT